MSNSNVMMQSQQIVDRVRKTIINVGNQNENETSQVDLNVSQFSNVLPNSMVLDQNNQ